MLCFLMMLIFFCKQKTADEMLIRDWSADVCSSDLRNIVDDNIRRRGWNESGSTKIYLRALRSSVMSLYEVSEVEPGSGFLVRDQIGSASCRARVCQYV